MIAEELILTKTWKELTEQERDEIRELAIDESSFNHMKSFMQQVQQIGTAEVFEPSASVKSGLDSVFAKQHAGRLHTHTVEPVRIPATKIVPIYQRNWTKIAAAVIFVVTSVLVWTWPGRQEIAPATRISKVDEPVVFSEWNPQGEKETEKPTTEEPTQVRSKQTFQPQPDQDVQADLQQTFALKNTASTGTITEDQPAVADYSYSTAEQQKLESRSRYTKDAEEDISESKMRAGMNADLFPNMLCPNSVAASSENLLSYIKPAF